MVTTRVLMRQNNTRYRFLRLEDASDGSVVVAVDRDTDSSVDGRTFTDGEFRPAQDRRGKPTPHARWTVHTSGIVNYRHANQEPTTQRIEPLYELTQNWLIGYVSVPEVTRLAPITPERTHDVEGIIDISPSDTGRITLGILVCPPDPIFDKNKFFLAANFETYAVAVTPLTLPFPVDADMADHFIYASPKPPVETLCGVGAAEAEIRFYQKIHGPTPLVFRQNSGSYVVLASQRMRVTPLLKVEFDRDDLSVEIIESQEFRHKVRFWIRDKGGRNKIQDLRKHIISLELNAEI